MLTIVYLSEQRHTGRLRKRDNLVTGGGGVGWARSRIIQYDRKKAWSPINHSTRPELFNLCFRFSKVASRGRAGGISRQTCRVSGRQIFLYCERKTKCEEK
jgi:hypothetical protein